MHSKILFHINIVAAGIVRLLLCKKGYTLYIGIFLVRTIEAQNLDLGLYRITDTLYNDTVTLFEKDIENIKKLSGFNSGDDGIEYFKDFLFKDSIIQKIREYPVEYTSFHGGTFDFYYGTMNDGVYSRTHNYGSSLYDGTYNEDQYFKNGKIIAWIRSEYLPYEPNSPTKIHFYLLSAESVMELTPQINSCATKIIIDEK